MGMAVVLWFFTFAIAWIVARPLIGIIVLLVDVAVVSGTIVYLRRRKSRTGVDPEHLIPAPGAAGAGYPQAREVYAASGASLTQVQPAQINMAPHPGPYSAPGQYRGPGVQSTPVTQP